MEKAPLGGHRPRCATHRCLKHVTHVPVGHCQDEGSTPSRSTTSSNTVSIEVVIERALHMWSAKDDIVFSPFTGIGSEGYCSVKMGRRFVGAELKKSYWKTAIDNLRRAGFESNDMFKDLD